MLVFKTLCYQYQQCLNLQQRHRTQCSDSKGRLSEKRCTLLAMEFGQSVTRLSEFAEGKCNCETVKIVASVIGRADVMFERFKIKGSSKQHSPLNKDRPT